MSTVADLLPGTSPRTRRLVAAMLDAGRDLPADELDQAFAAALGALGLEQIGADNLAEWGGRCALYALELDRAGRHLEAAMIGAAARVMLA